jgi:hypothetical protein
LEKLALGEFFETLHGRPAAKSVVFAAYRARVATPKRED